MSISIVDANGAASTRRVASFIVALAVTFGGQPALCDDGAPKASQVRPVARRTPTKTATETVIGAPPKIPPVITPGHQRMLHALEQIRAEMGENPFSPYKQVEEYRALFSLSGPELKPSKRVEKLFLLAVDELKLGEEEEAISHFLETYNALPEPRTNENARMCDFWLGVAYLRYAETQNCCSRNTPDSCLLPIRGQGIHTQREGSTKAIACFLRVLQNEPAGTLNRANALWLLNIANMTLDEYPHGVPEKYRLPQRMLESDEPFPRFPNVAGKVGLNVLNCAGGMIVEDFNNDDYLDVFVTQMNMDGQTRMWLNRGDGTFREVTEEAGLKGLFGGLNCNHTDYNNDGYADVFILRGGWMMDHGQHPNSLLRNNGDGTFTDVTYEAGLGDECYPTQTASWADIDGDGDLDLYIGNELSLRVTAPCQLFRNNGNGTFTNIAREAGVTNDRYAKGVIFGDYDQDGRPDIYVSNLDADNRLYHNNGDGTFTDVAPKLGLVAPYDGFPAWFWDYDNDGALDIYASAYALSAGHLATDLMGQKQSLQTQRLYRGDGRGGFQDVTERVKLDRLNAPMGANFGDLDNDGFLDFYLGTGRPDYWQLMPNVMFHNRGGVDFADVTTAGGFGSLQKGHGVAFGDIDNDGDQDIFSQLGGAYPGDKYFNALYENPGFGNHFLTVKLVGATSNRAAIGARIRVDIQEGGKTRSVYRHVNSGGSFGDNSFRQTLGLGRAEKIDRLEILWPTTGKTQVFTDVPLDEHIRITEDAPKWEPIHVKAFALGGTPAAKSVTTKPQASTTANR